MLHGRYELRQIIGSGAHGNVYHGLDLTSQIFVAIKQLRPDVVRSDPDLLQRFQREALALRQLNHPNIVHVLDTFTEASDHYIVMDFLSGGSLRGLLDQIPCQGVEQTLRLALDLSDALIRAHRLGIIHRDLKPANVLLAEDGTPRLTDFGVAFLPEQERLTESRGFVGTLSYIAPEVINGEAPSPSSDIWSFGVMLYEMLAGVRPFDQPTATGLIVAILTQPPGDLEEARPDVPASLIDLIYRMLDKNVQTRVATVRRVSAELEIILQAVVNGHSAASVGWAHAGVTTDKIDILPTVSHNLPAQTTAFVGRERELEDLLRLLRDPSPSRPRLVTLLGPGGMGKSRLSIEVGQKLLLADEASMPYPDGVYFVALAHLSTPDRLTQAIAEVVGYVMQENSGEPLEQLATFFTDRQTILILDNFEHVMEATPILVRLLEAAPHLTLFITSRERLNLSAEHLYALKGLSIPAGPAAVSLLEYGAVQLFVQSAQRVQPGFALKDADVEAVAQICRVVQGLPLGIMLAATWTEMLNPTEILIELNKTAEFLEANMKDLPERHRSIRAVFEHSWQRLTESERQTLARLSVFSGAFSRAAAQAVTEANLRDLMQLVNKSLLYRDSETGLYTLHELIRQFAEMSLKTTTDEYHRALETHSRYYCLWLKSLLPIMWGPQIGALQAMDAEINNIRQAFQHAIKQKDIEALEGAEETLATYYRIRNQYEERISNFNAAIDVLEALASDPKRDRALGRFYIRQGFLYGHLNAKQRVKHYLENGLSLLRKVGDDASLSIGLVNFAQFLDDCDADKAEIIEISLESLALAQKCQIVSYAADIEVWLAWLYARGMKQGEDIQSSFSWAEKALAQFTQIDQPEGRAHSLKTLSYLYFLQENYEKSIEMCHAALPLFEQIGAWSSVAHCWISIHHSYKFIREYQRARDALAQARLVGNTKGFAAVQYTVYFWWAYLDLVENRHDEALQHLAEAAKYADAPRIYNASEWIAAHKIRIYVAMNALSEADSLLQHYEHTDDAIKQDNPLFFYFIDELRGRWYRANRRFDEAESLYRRLLREGTGKSYGATLFCEVMTGLAQVWAGQERFHEAVRVCRLLQNAKGVWPEELDKVAIILEMVRDSLTETDWTQIEAEVGSTTIQEYAETLIKE